MTINPYKFSSSASREAQSKPSDSTGPRGAAIDGDNDFVPADVFDPAPRTRRNDRDMVPADIFHPAQPTASKPSLPKPTFPAATTARAATQTETPMIRTRPRFEPPTTGPASLPAGIDHLLRLAASLGASTLYLSSNAAPAVRIDDVVHPLEGTPILSPFEVESLIVALVLAHHSGTRGALAIKQWSFDLADVGRVRCITSTDARGPSAVFRITPFDRLAEAAGLSPDIQALAAEREGLVIVAGPRGSGKQALIGALVDLVNRSRRTHVIWVQRESGSANRRDGSVVSERPTTGGLDDILATARDAMQENPDVLVLEEARSAALISLAFDAAASGQLVIVGFTAPSAAVAVERIVDLFPTEQSRQVQLSLSHHLRGIVGQVLVTKTSGGRVAARELVRNTRAVSSVLAAGKVEHLGVAIATGSQHGPSMTEAMIDLVQTGTVSAADAYRQAPDQAAFLEELKRLGIDTSFALA